MKYLILLSLVFLSACEEDVICYPSPVIGQSDMCHTKLDWDKISDQNWKDVQCMNRDDKGNGLTEKQHKAALKRCGLKEGKSYTNDQIK